jgi:predicted site-specific integrase-resolvase
MPFNQLLLSPIQAAACLRISSNTLAKWRVSGDGPTFVKVGARVFYDQEDIFEWITENKRSNTSTVQGVTR